MSHKEFSVTDIGDFAWHLKVQGAYVQQPNPAIYGLEDDIVIGSNDANALYPISIVHQNLGFDTVNSRLYDSATIGKFVGLLRNVYRSPNKEAEIESALSGFRTAFQTLLKDYYDRKKSVQKKKENLKFSIEYYESLLERILRYDGKLEDIFEPKDDRTYFLCKSCLYPLFETVSWLSPQNRGYNQTVVNYVFFNEEFIQKPQDIYIFTDINSTKTKFRVMPFEEALDLFSRKILNPYGVLIDKHKDNLAFDVDLIRNGLRDRKLIKDRALLLGAVLSQWDKLTEKHYNYFINPANGKFMSDEQALDILETINDTQDRNSRTKSFTTIEFEIDSVDAIQDFMKLREAQFNSMQTGIKVTLNSLYGIYGLITWQYSSPLIGNAITTAGKIYGIKLFQAVTTGLIQDLNDKIDNGEYENVTEYRP